jgi:ketosteroid isomerase-like protein
VRAEGDAIVKKDKAALERLYAEDYLYAHSNGVVANRAADITTSIAADTKWTAVSYTDLKVRVYGDAAILTGTETLAGTAKGYVPGPRRFTDAWIKAKSGSWQLVAGGTTIVSNDQSEHPATSSLKALNPKSIAGSTPDERAVMEQDAAYRNTEVTNDGAKAKALQTKDFSFVSRSGAVATPADPPGPDVKSLVVAYDRVAVYGPVAIVQGSLLWSDVKGFSPGVLRFVRVWVKDGGAWKLAAEQRTPVAAVRPTT